MISVTKRSPFSGKFHTREIDITEEQLRAYYAGHSVIQKVFPQLSADDREFLMTGITPEEWDDTFKER